VEYSPVSVPDSNRSSLKRHFVQKINRVGLKGFAFLFLAGLLGSCGLNSASLVPATGTFVFIPIPSPVGTAGAVFSQFSYCDALQFKLSCGGPFVPKDKQINPSGGSGGPFVFSIKGNEGFLPPGLVLHLNGLVTGTVSPTAKNQYYNFTVCVEDTGGASFKSECAPTYIIVYTQPPPVVWNYLHFSCGNSLACMKAIGYSYGFDPKYNQAMTPAECVHLVATNAMGLRPWNGTIGTWCSTSTKATQDPAGTPRKIEIPQPKITAPRPPIAAGYWLHFSCGGQAQCEQVMGYAYGVDPGAPNAMTKAACQKLVDTNAMGMTPWINGPAGTWCQDTPNATTHP